MLLAPGKREKLNYVCAIRIVVRSSSSFVRDGLRPGDAVKISFENEGKWTVKDVFPTPPPPLMLRWSGHFVVRRRKYKKTLKQWKAKSQTYLA